MKTATELKKANFGSVSSGTLKTEDLLAAIQHELQWQIMRNGAFLAMPENFPLRDRLNALDGEICDCFSEGNSGESEITEDKQEIAQELIGETCDVLSEVFAPAYGYFGAHCGDGADFGFWPGDIEDIKEQVGFVSSVDEEYPSDDFSGEWLHVNERGNCTLYVRENGIDREIWGLV